MFNWKNNSSYASQLAKGAVIFGAGALACFGMASLWRGGKSGDGELVDVNTNGKGKDGASLKLYNSYRPSEFSLQNLQRSKDSLLLDALDNLDDAFYGFVICNKKTFCLKYRSTRSLLNKSNVPTVRNLFCLD